jgi:hypothetical protein
MWMLVRVIPSSLHPLTKLISVCFLLVLVGSSYIAVNPLYGQCGQSLNARFEVATMLMARILLVCVALSARVIDSWYFEEKYWFHL